jgi:hypothetical protein
MKIAAPPMGGFSRSVRRDRRGSQSRPMPLHFTCPNGHSISCHEKLSGRPAKCPQCGTKFMVPPAGQEQADPLTKDSAIRGGSSKSGGVAT